MDPGSAAHRFALRSVRGTLNYQDVRLSEICPAALRKQSGHTQSPPSIGIGRRNASSVHQQGPDGLQVNSVPQPEQARRRDGRVPNRFVMNQAAM
jgi:hypothetical protein